MSAAFTPGEWEAICVGMSSAGDDGLDVYEIVAGGHRRVAEHLTHADARLASAAPEMYAELLDILRSIKGGGDVVTFGAADIARYEALLDRATGTAS